MKNSKLRIILLSIILGITLGASQSLVTAQNTINGMVFDPNRKPVPELYVELLDSVEQLIRSVKTRGGGFYSFNALRPGVYYIKVRVAGTNFKNKKTRFNLGNISTQSGVEVKQLDIYLQLDPRKTGKTPSITGVFFAQNVPKDAKKSYEKGLNNINKNKEDEAIKNFLNSIHIFPEYFDALFRLGDTYLTQKKFTEAENVLNRAANVNTKNSVVFYGLAIAQNNLKKQNQAIENLNKAIALNASSINTYLLLGKIQRNLKQYVKAEKSLLKAKTLASNKNPDINYDLALLYYYNLKKHNEAATELEFYIKNLSKSEYKKNRQKVSAFKKIIKKIRSEAGKKS